MFIKHWYYEVDHKNKFKPTKRLGKGRHAVFFQRFLVIDFKLFHFIIRPETPPDFYYESEGL